MKKIFTTTLVSLVSFVTIVSADFIRAEIGTGVWTQTATGKSYYNGSTSGARGTDKLQENVNTSNYVWAFIKHPIPIVPNLRLGYVNIHGDGTATGEWSGLGIPSGSSSTSTLDLKEYDIIPYYNILDNTFWVTLDLGLDIKIIDLDYKISKKTFFAGYQYKSTIQLPLGYIRARAQIPTTDLGFEADVKYIQYGSSTIYDIRAKVDYTFDISPLIQPALEIGYRAQRIKIDDSSSDIKTDINFAGPYVGLFLRF